MEENTIEIIREKAKNIINKYDFSNENITIKTKTLTPQEAIGNPEHNDYPIIKGKERLLEAEFKNSKGVAFSDMFGNFKAKLNEIINMKLKNNFQRAIFVSSLNAVLRELNLIEKTRHCKNEDLIICSKDVCEFIRKNFGKPKIFLCGLQPRLAEKLSSEFEINITDMDAENIGKKINKKRVKSEKATDSCIAWCDMIFATGSTFVNNTAPQLIKSGKPIVFFGVTAAAPTYLLNLPRFCPRGE
ncbi:hypothetical protein KKB41_02420 [Patescibacteria group bacterium]|nr:hypothetical protein [Patescibacteria group bacterium]